MASEGRGQIIKATSDLFIATLLSTPKNEPLLRGIAGPSTLAELQRFASDPDMQELERRRKLWRQEYHSGLTAAMEEGEAIASYVSPIGALRHPVPSPSGKELRGPKCPKFAITIRRARRRTVAVMERRSSFSRITNDDFSFNRLSGVRPCSGHSGVHSHDPSAKSAGIALCHAPLHSDQ